MPAFQKNDSSEFVGARYEVRAKRELSGSCEEEVLLFQVSPADRGRNRKATVGMPEIWAFTGKWLDRGPFSETSQTWKENLIFSLICRIWI